MERDPFEQRGWRPFFCFNAVIEQNQRKAFIAAGIVHRLRQTARNFGRDSFGHGHEDDAACRALEKSAACDRASGCKAGRYIHSAQQLFIIDTRG